MAKCALGMNRIHAKLTMLYSIGTYRVFKMDRGHFKELLWLRFWCQAFFLIILVVEKCVHFDIWNKKILKFERVL